MAQRQSRSGVSCKGLLWITAKDRVTGAPATIGLWDGDDHDVFTIQSQNRTYFGAGNLIRFPDLTASIGVRIRTLSVVLSALTPEVQQAVKAYDARHAPAEIHLAEFSPETNNLIDAPDRVVKGWIDKINWGRPGARGESTCTLTIVSAARALTRTLPHKYSDAAQRLVDPADAFNRYTAVSTVSDVWWGEKRVASTAVSAAPSGMIGQVLAKVNSKAGR